MVGRGLVRLDSVVYGEVGVVSDSGEGIFGGRSESSDCIGCGDRCVGCKWWGWVDIRWLMLYGGVE